MGGITDSPLFETAIAMVVVWLAAATLTSGIVELIATALSFRANHLWDWLEGLLTPKDSPAPAVRGQSPTRQWRNEYRHLKGASHQHRKSIFRSGLYPK